MAEHIWTLAQKYPFSAMYITTVWHLHGCCSMVKLEEYLKRCMLVVRR